MADSILIDALLLTALFILSVGSIPYAFGVGWITMMMGQRLLGLPPPPKTSDSQDNSALHLYRAGPMIAWTLHFAFLMFVGYWMREKVLSMALLVAFLSTYVALLGVAVAVLEVLCVGVAVAKVVGYLKGAANSKYDSPANEEEQRSLLQNADGGSVSPEGFARTRALWA